MLKKFKKINYDFVTQKYTELTDAIEKIEGLTQAQKEQVAGLCVECVIQSGGDVEILEDSGIILDEKSDITSEDFLIN